MGGGWGKFGRAMSCVYKGGSQDHVATWASSMTFFFTTVSRERTEADAGRTACTSLSHDQSFACHLNGCAADRLSE